MSYYYDRNALIHYGVSGQKWGVRRYQNEDGSLTQLGKEHYSTSSGGNSEFAKKYSKEVRKLEKLSNKADIDVQTKAAEKHEKRAQTTKKIGNAALAIGASAAGVAGLSNAISNRRIQQKFSGTGIAMRNIGDRLNQGNKGWNDDEVRSARDVFWDAAKRFENASDVIGSDKVRSAAIDAWRPATWTGIISGATAATMYGASAYNKLAAKVNKHRLTDKGHAKAVARMEAQYNKVTNMVKGTSYMSLFKDQIDAYKKEHPNTELSDKQIMKNLM